MSAIVRFVGATGTAATGLAERLRAAAFAFEAGEIAPAETELGAVVAEARRPATLLVTVAQTAGLAIAAATDFASALAVQAEDRLVINIWHLPAAADWEPSRDAATMAAFTRYAALAWAGRRVRVNGVTLGSAPDGRSVAEDDVAATILALWRWRSMTGQVVHLGG